MHVNQNVNNILWVGSRSVSLKTSAVEKALLVILQHTVEGVLSLHVLHASTAHSHLSMHNVLWPENLCGVPKHKILFTV